MDSPLTPFGVLRSVIIRNDKDTLINLSQTYDLGYNEITDANPGVDPWFPGRGTRVIVPTTWLIPSFPEKLVEQGPLIIINLAEMRLYRVWKDTERLGVMTFPIGIGREGAETPLGLFRITEKERDPYWIIPPSIRNEYPHLPDIVPPGVNNPLGRYALRLSVPEYLIHGTNRPLGVGRRVSHGCIRMYNQDVETLFRYAKTGEPVLITYEPVKVGKKNGQIYIEAHRDYLKKGISLNDVIAKIRGAGMVSDIKTDTLYKTIFNARGYPMVLR